MRILELRLDAESGPALELHPNLTLVRGLDASQRQVVVESIRAMSQGQPTATGLIEAYGVMFDLVPRSLKLLGLEQGVDVAVRSNDLPGHDHDGEVATRELARAEADLERKRARLSRAQQVLQSVNEARASLARAIEDTKRQDSVRADDVVRATTALASARQERHRARSIREMVERELADARAAQEAMVGSRQSTSEALRRAKERHRSAVSGCEAAATAVRDAHAAVAAHESDLAAARAAVEEAEAAASTADAEPASQGEDEARLAGDADAPERSRAGRLFRGRRHEQRGGGLAVTARPEPVTEAMDPDGASSPSSLFSRRQDVGGRQVPPSSPRPPVDRPEDQPEDEDRLQRLEGRRREAGEQLAGMEKMAPTTEVRAARDELVALGPAAIPPQWARARKLAARWRELAREREARGWTDLDGSRLDDPAGSDPSGAGTSRAEGQTVASGVVDVPSAAEGAPRSSPGDAAPSTTWSEPEHVAEARARLARAEHNRDEAHAAADRSATGPDEIRALEAAHSAVLDAQERTETRFGGAKAQRRLAQARAEERAILDQLGFSTYADYMMSASDRFHNGADLAVLDTADRALITARQGFIRAWRDAYDEEPPSVPCPPKQPSRAELPVEDAPVEPDRDAVAVPPTAPAAGSVDPDTDPVATDGDPRLAELLAEQDEVRREAETILGHPAGGDVAGDLEVHCSDFGPPTDPSTDDLTRLLSSVGIAVQSENLSRGTLIEYADAWLDEQQVLAWRRAELEAELDQIDRDVVRMNDAIATQRDQRAAAEADQARSHREALVNRAQVTEETRQRLAELDGSGEGQRLAEELRRSQAELEARTAEESEAAAAVEAAGDPGHVATDEDVSAAARRLSEAERAAENAFAAERSAAEAVAELEQRVADYSDPAHDLAEQQVRLDAVDQDRARAESDLVLAESEHEMAVQTVQAMVEAESARRQERARNQLAKGSLLEDIDWYLLSRLASQRSVGVAGSLPLVIDDAFSELPPTEANWLLGRLERMTDAVQVIVLTDEPEQAAWVEQLGEGRGAVVSV